MARGKGRGHKGQRRHFTTPEEMKAREELEEKRNAWRGSRDDSDEDDSEEETESSSEEDPDKPKKGVEGLIEIENPNRIKKKPNKKLLNDPQAAGPSKAAPSKAPSKPGGDEEDAPQLSRREREEIEKQKAREAYQRLHAAGKTDEARADLARLALIRQQREEAAKKRDEERKRREAMEAEKSALTKKALGKK